jgi:hypothetical protein
MDASVEVHPGIFIRENFLTPEEVNAIMEMCSTKTDADWFKRGRDGVTIESLGLVSVVRERLEDLFDPELYIIRSFSQIQRREAGEHDALLWARKHEDERCYMSVLIIINDNYEGGEINFVDQEFEIRPKAGEIIIFPPTEEYKYNIKPIADGGPFRYVLPENIFHVEPDQGPRRPVTV